MKHLIGKQVWLSPTGNNKSRNDKYKIETGKITSVGRIKLDLSLGGTAPPRKFNFYDGKHGTVLDSGFNAGYIMFETEQAISEYHLRLKLAEGLFRKLSNPRDWESLSLDQLVKIAEIAEVKA